MMDKQIGSDANLPVQNELQAMREKIRVMAQGLTAIEKELGRLTSASASERESDVLSPASPPFAVENTHAATICYTESSTPAVTDNSSNNKAESQPCTNCLGWDWTGHDCYRMGCVHNKHKYGDVPGASDLWPHGG